MLCVEYLGAVLDTAARGLTEETVMTHDLKLQQEMQKSTPSLHDENTNEVSIQLNFKSLLLMHRRDYRSRLSTGFLSVSCSYAFLFVGFFGFMTS
jgi:hypothetical protein